MIGFDEFMDIYDRPGTIVLLEGKRKVKEEEQEKLTAFGRQLAEFSEYIIFRSGNAAGSDELFSKGVAEVDPGRLQVFSPYRGHRKRYVLTEEILSLDDLDMSMEQDLIECSLGRAGMAKLVQQYLEGKRHKYAMRAAYIIRDCMKVVGSNSCNMMPASFAFFYDDLTKPMSGGTGHTMEVCKSRGIPFADQKIWFDWL